MIHIDHDWWEDNQVERKIYVLNFRVKISSLLKENENINFQKLFWLKYKNNPYKNKMQTLNSKCDEYGPLELKTHFFVSQHSICEWKEQMQMQSANEREWLKREQEKEEAVLPVVHHARFE